MSINRKASKKHCVISDGVDVENLSFTRYLEYFGADRLVTRLTKGRIVKPCGKECWDYGFMIAKSFNHASFENFKQLMNDKEFLLEIAKITPKPTECVNYFWLYINPYLKKDNEFRLKFLKSVYLNDEVYELDVINTFVDFCGLQKENEIILKDDEFKQEIINRLQNICCDDYINYNYSGCDKKQLHNYKVEANDVRVLCDNMKIGLCKILSTFESEKKEEVDIRDLIDIEFFN